MSSTPAAGRSVPQTLHAQLRDRLRADILEGRLRPDGRLRSEYQLANDFSVSRITVRQALSDLVAQGLIVKIQGKGAFVASRPVAATFDRIEGLAEAVAPSGLRIQNRRLRLRRMRASADVAAMLALKAGAEVVVLETLRYVDRRPLSVNRCVMPLSIGLRIAKLDLSDRDLVDVYERDLGHELANEDVQVGARTPSTTEATLLGVDTSLPCLEVIRQIATAAGIPIHHETALYRGDVYQQRFRLRR
jgi:GntR family transcriptional regulator